MPVVLLSRNSGNSFPTILLASDSENPGSFMHGLLQAQGFITDYAGFYSEVGPRLASEQFDVILLEVTTTESVEAAVAVALQVKRGQPGQFVGYLADSMLDTAGLAGDAVFPRSAARLPEALRSFFAETGGIGRIG
jgi:hypothetical protein